MASAHGAVLSAVSRDGDRPLEHGGRTNRLLAKRLAASAACDAGNKEGFSRKFFGEKPFLVRRQGLEPRTY